MAAPPLEAELRTMLATERRVLRQLSIAYTGISRDLARLERKHGPGAMVERAQLREMRAAISTQMAGMWRAVGNEIRAGRIEAGGAAGARLGEALDVFRSAGLSAAEVAGMKATMEASARAGVEAALKRVQGRSYIPLSARVYATSVAADSRLQDVINTELLKGANWARMAKAVREHIRPDVAGGVPYAAKRLARTEINNAFHATTLDKMRAEPFVDYVQWELSGSHKRPDVCNEYAETAHTKTGEPGVYRNGDTPERPHPQCLCFVSAVDIGVDEFLRRFKGGEMNDWLRDEGFEIDDLQAKQADAGPALGGTPVKLPVPKIDLRNLDADGHVALARYLTERGVVDEGVTISSKGRNGFIDFRGVDAKGERVFRAERSIESDERGEYVYHSLFRVKREFQGQGTATKFNAAMEDLYRANGITRIRLNANIDVGGYTWARHGYDWDPDPKMMAGNAMTFRLVARKLMRAKELSAAERARAESWLELSQEATPENWPTPFEISRMGWTEGAKTWPGKEAMLGETWDGVKEL